MSRESCVFCVHVETRMNYSITLILKMKLVITV